MGTHALVYFTTGTTIEAIAHHSSDGYTEEVQLAYARFVAEVARGRQRHWKDPNLAASRWCAFHLLNLWVQQWKNQEDSRVNWPSLYRADTAAVTPLEMMTVRMVHGENFNADYVHRIDFEHNAPDQAPFIRSLKLDQDAPAPTRRHKFWSPIRAQETPLPGVADHPLLRPVWVNVDGLVVPQGATGMEPALTR